MDLVEKIKSLTPDHFSEICRICLSSEALRLIQETLVDNIEATDLFEYTIGVQFDKNDLMPANICDKCLTTLYEMYKLKKQCLMNEVLFKIQINNYKTLPKEELSREEEIQDNIVKTEKEVEEDTVSLNGDIVNTATKTSDKVWEFNDVKVEPDDYDLTFEIEKGNKTEEGPEVRKIVSTEHTIGTFRTEQPIFNLLKNVKNTQQPIILSSARIPNCIKETGNTLDTRTTFPMTTPVMYNSSTCSYTSNAVKPMYIVKYQQNQTDNLPIVPGAKGPGTRQVYLLNLCPTKSGSGTPTTFNLPLPELRKLPTKENTKVLSSDPKTDINEKEVSGQLKTHETKKCRLQCDTTTELNIPPPEPKKMRDNTKVPCTICEKLIGSRTMASHLITHQTQRHMYQCDQCTRNFKTKWSLKLHQIHHTGIYPYRCFKCKKGFVSASINKIHMASCKNDKEGPKHCICKVCGRNFANRVAFRRHLRQHLVQKETDKEDIIEYFKGCSFSCDLCLSSYESETSLKYHIKNSHSGLSFLCNICGKNMCSKSSLETHIKTHTGEKPFSCEVCEKTFVNLAGLKSHMRKHSDERPFKCNICAKTFKNLKSLNFHLLMHKGDKPHKCNFCDKQFAIRGNLQKHVATHTGLKRHFCSICNKGFYDRNMMTNHKAKHDVESRRGRKIKRENMD